MTGALGLAMTPSGSTLSLVRDWVEVAHQVANQLKPNNPNPNPNPDPDPDPNPNPNSNPDPNPNPNPDP